MRPALLLLINMLVGGLAFGQSKTTDSSRGCSQVMTQISYYWKLDSLAGNGFRFCTYKEFLDCKIDQVDSAFLLEKLGKPNELKKTNHGVEYIYYYFDIRAMPKGYDAPLACWYISFSFNGREKYVQSIEEGDIDR